MKIAVVGTGYVGLVAGACFADTGNTVYCVDKDPSKVDSLKRSEIPFFEPGLETLVKRGVKEKRLLFSTSIHEAVREGEVIFIAVGTPALPNGEPNLEFLKSAAEDIARAMNGKKIVINKSTVPVGAHHLVAEWMEPFANHPFEVVSNPEFLKEGSAVEDFLKPDRVIVGTENTEAFEKIAKLYAPFMRQGNPIVQMDPVSAELTKYACNTFLATRISFMNELAVLCEKVEGDIDLVRKGMSMDQRIGKHFLYAGAGFGGSCFPKDMQALLDTAKKKGTPLGIIEAAYDANERQKLHLVHKVKEHFGKSLNGKTLAIWGLAFKPNTDDVREAPALAIIRQLLDAGAAVQVFDPVALANAKKDLGENPKITYCERGFDALEGADALILVTEWNEFRHPDFDRMKTLLKRPVVFDGRNLYEPEQMAEMGFIYYGIGRGRTSQI